MFNFRKLPLFNRDQTKDTEEVKNFLNSHEGIYFSASKKFINVFVDKVLFIDPLNLNVTTINTDLFVVDFCFSDKTNNLIVLGKSKNALVCSIYNIRANNFTLLKKINLSRNIENIKKTLISKCLGYIITLENKKISFYLINNDYSINKSELIEMEEDLFENIYLCKDNIFVIIKKSFVNMYKLIIKDSSISYTFIEGIKLNVYPSVSSTNKGSNNDKSDILFEPILSIYNEEIDVLYICNNEQRVLLVVDMSNRNLEYILLECRAIKLFTVKFYLIFLTEVNRKFCMNIYIIHENLKLLAFTATFTYLITNIVFFNNLLFLIIDELVHKPEVKVDTFYFYEQLKMKWNGIGDGDTSRNSKMVNMSNIFKETEKQKSQNDIDILKIFSDNVNNGNSNSNVTRGDIKYDIFLEKREDERREEGYNIEHKQYSYDKRLFKLNNVFTNCRNKIKIVIKEKNINEIINMFKKKKLFTWLIKYADLNKNYHSINFGYVHKLYADFLFEKEQHERAMYHYIKTIGFLETANVIHKYLSQDLYEYLSVYLEKLHDTNLFNDEHTMMLLSCYKKECKKKKIISFIKHNKNKINLNRTYKFLSNIGYYNVVLKFSRKNKDHLTYISILIDKYENYEKSLKYIFKLDVENICILLFRYGYKFIKYFPELTIYLLRKIIKKYNLNLTIFIPLFLDNIDFLFIFILKFLDQKGEHSAIPAETGKPMRGKKKPQREGKDDKAGKGGNDDKDRKNEKENLPIHDTPTYEGTTAANIISNRKIEFDIFNGDYDYILFVTVMQILLQKYKKREKNHILTFNIDKLIKNRDKNITFLSVILLSIYSYNKGLFYISNQMHKYDMSFLFSINKIIKNFKIMYNQQLALASSTKFTGNQDNVLPYSNNIFEALNKKLEKNIFNACMHLLKLKDSLFHNYIFYYLSQLNDDKYLIRFIKKIKKKSPLSPLNLISILQKYNRGYNCIKKIVIAYINEMNKNINKKHTQILRDQKELYKIKKKLLERKYSFHIIDNTYCALCKEILSIPIIHFLCNHSYHFSCLNGNEICVLCRNKDNEKKFLKEKAKNTINNFDEFFKYLQGSTDKFSFISNYLSYGVTPGK
ncbi:vacuolar protein sorting-associated protein 11, putative [Plasmodium ovale]|uniref:Vacuolar protein sorting-associated protein 11, putative n=1 Tax=Plasmodium ovale TaxID=36330 RepID=A0A1D3U9A5_PLAOA|nr:vacuolar protein sorting-associated protein 11, putative [Plasmodium ovale]